MTGGVWLVGAGPGAPDLISVRGLDLIERADVVVYDRLVSPQLLDHAPEHAELIYAGKGPGHHAMTQEAISRLLVRHGSEGKRVVRLKGGDPFLFGRGGEERQACVDAGVPVRVVPGITSAVGVPTHAGVPLTHRGVAASILITTPETGGDPALPGSDRTHRAVAGCDADTVVLLMARARIRETLAQMVRCGRSPDTLAVAIERGTWEEERRVSGTLSTLADAVEEQALRAPILLVAGPTARFPEKSAGDPPLAGKRVLLTRPIGAARGLAARLREAGASVVQAPMIEMAPTPVSHIPALSEWEWVVFTSRHGVEGFRKALTLQGLDARVFGKTKIAVVGHAATEALSHFGLVPDLVPARPRVHALIEALLEREPRSVLFPGGSLGWNQVGDLLKRGGVSRVLSIRVYETLRRRPSPRIQSELQQGFDTVVLHSPTGAASLASSGRLPPTTTVVAVGEATKQAALEAGLVSPGSPVVLPAERTDEGIVNAVISLAESVPALSEPAYQTVSTDGQEWSANRYHYDAHCP